MREYFKNADLQKISHTHIIDFRNHLLDKKLSNKSVNNIISTLNKIFETAQNEKFIQNNPCSKIKKLPLDRKKMKFWRPEELKKFLTIKSFLKTFYALAFFTGMRCGEMLALHWKDIDRILMEIDVRKSATYLKKEFIVTLPKTKNSIRRISINRKLFSLLDYWREKQEIYLKNSIFFIQMSPIFFNIKTLHHQRTFSVVKLNTSAKIVI
uniref:tyrosine-type recombinase/integrase n=1 Tax=Bacillus paralicheniformis TaxID=1648923 RepID=UPI002B4B9B36|nr:phage integrase SAM-like domain-containing protein [Bacillus paralicheniformis]